MDADRDRLRQAIEARAAQLRLRLQEVASRASMSLSTLGRVRAGVGALTPYVVASLEDALEWTHGSVQAILAGDAPTPVSRPVHDDPAVAEILTSAYLTPRQKSALVSELSRLRAQEDPGTTDTNPRDRL